MHKQFIALFLLLALVTVPFADAAEVQLTSAQLNNISLETATVTSRKNSARLRLNGVLEADQRRTYRIASIVDGIVYDLKVVEHDQVRKGQVLARLRSHSLGEAQAEYLEALALFELAQSNKTRIEGLWNEGIVAENRWRTVESEYKRAQAVLGARKRMLSLAGLTKKQIKNLTEQPNILAKVNLVSPINGIVTGVEIEAGQLLGAGQTGFHVDDLSVLWAVVKIPVAHLPQIELGVDVTVIAQAYPEQLYEGKLTSLSSEIDIQSQTLSGRIILKNEDGKLRPGMYVNVALDTAAKHGLLVPASAVFRVGDQAYVFKTSGADVFIPIAVSIGAQAGNWVPVHSGIEEGTQIVSKGVAELKSHWQYQGGN